MAQEPTNMRLWQICVIQARAHFKTYPSPSASAWVHKKYKQMGGQFKGKADLPGRPEK